MPNGFFGCWIWTACKQIGYGQFLVDGKPVRAHRFSYQIFRGSISPGHYICHRCDTRACVNPLHLFAGTQKENMNDASKKGRLSGQRKKYVSVPKSDETAPRARLKNSDVYFIRDSSLSTKELMKIFGVCKHTINRVKNKSSYREVL